MGERMRFKVITLCGSMKFKDDFKKMEEVIANTSNPFLLAKCYDLLYMKTQEKKYCEEAINQFYLAALQFINIDKTFGALEFIKRSLFLSKTISNHSRISLIIDDVVFNHKYKEANDLERIINAIFDFFKIF